MSDQSDQMRNVWRATTADGEPLPIKQIDISGRVFGIYAENPATGEVKPVLLDIAGNEVLAVFTTVEKMRECYRLCGAEPLKIKQVLDAEFLESLRHVCPVVLDPWLTSRGTVRFTLLSAPQD